jgi:hypothetical protein
MMSFKVDQAGSQSYLSFHFQLDINTYWNRKLRIFKRCASWG